MIQYLKTKATFRHSGAVKAALGALCLFAGGQVFAGLATSTFNYNNDIVGDRATGLGGAFTAISDDPSGAYYNPAGLSFAADNQISLSVNTYKTKSISYDKAIGGNTTYEQSIESFYPSLFGVVQSFGSVKVAFTFINLNNEIVDQDQTFRDVAIPQNFVDDNGDPIGDEYAPITDFTINFNNTDNTLLIGLSGSAFITDGWTFGGTVYMFRRRREQISNQVIRFKSWPDVPTTTFDERTQRNRFLHTNSYITDDIVGINPRFGTQFMPSNKLSFGASVGFGFVLDHERTTQTFTNQGSTRLTEDEDSTTTATRTQSSGDVSDTTIPLNARAGFAFFPSKRFLWTVDVIADIGDQNYEEVAETTINYATGIEYYVTNALPMRVGVFTNFANTPEVTTANSNENLHVDLYGIALSFSWQSRNSSITLGGFYQANFFSDGNARIVSSSTDIQKVDVSMLQVGLTGSAKY